MAGRVAGWVVECMAVGMVEWVAECMAGWITGGTMEHGLMDGRAVR